MHDIDSTFTEHENDLEAYTNEYEEEFEGEYEDEDEYESEDPDNELEFEDEFEEEFEDELETEAPSTASPDVFSDGELEMMAAELLSVSGDQELELFLKRLVKRVGRRVRKVAKSRTGRRLRKILKGVAKKALRVGGRALGTAVAGPAGRAIGQRAGKVAGRVLGLELEGLAPEEQEFEAAKQVIRLASDATKHATLAQSHMTPEAAAKAGVLQAAQKHAPGLLRGRGKRPQRPCSHARSGRWVRRGGSIVLEGA